MPDLFAVTADQRWRVYLTSAGTGFDLIERRGPETITHLRNATLAEVGEFLAGQGYGAGELRPA